MSYRGNKLETKWGKHVTHSKTNPGIQYREYGEVEGMEGGMEREPEEEL